MVALFEYTNVKYTYCTSNNSYCILCEPNIYCELNVEC